MRKVIIIDFGSQYTKLIANVIRNLNAYSEIVLPSYFEKDVPVNPEDEEEGIYILSGGPGDVSKDSKDLQIIEKLKGNSYILGICYGAQLIAHYFGAINYAGDKEFGKTQIRVINSCREPKKNSNTGNIFGGIPENINVWMSHNNSISFTQQKDIKENINILAESDSSIAAFRVYSNIYGLTFHPEVTHCEYGKDILRNFLRIAGCDFGWTPQNKLASIQKRIARIVGQDEYVLVACSGGVDSTVTAKIIQSVIGDRMIAVFINNGLLREGEYEQVKSFLQNIGLNVTGINHSKIFLERLAGITCPKTKRQIIGETFIKLFTEYRNILTQNIVYLGQGTIYPDVIESMGGIKSHHNVGCLPEKMELKLLEPIRELFKDEVREIGVELGIAEDIINRHPFPGPGLAIRLVDTDVTSEKLRILRKADKLFIDKLRDDGYYDKVWQANVELLPVRSVGVKGDKRCYGYVCVLRVITSVNGMTASVFEFPMSYLKEMSGYIVNRVDEISRIVYDITDKPPATIEWE